MRTLLSSLLALTLLGLAACKPSTPAAGGDAGTAAPAAPGAPGALTIKGSDTMVILVQRWAEEYMKQHPEAKLQVTGGGSGTGIAALINGTTEIAMSSRPMKEAEAMRVKQRSPSGPVEIAVARDGVTFYVNEANPVQSLTIAQLKGIYLGDIANWKEVGGPDAPIVVYSRENSSGTYAFVKDEVLGGGDYTERAQTLPGTAAVVNAVAKEKNGIGYGGAAYAKGVKELKVQGAQGQPVAPTAEAIQSGEYPLSRNLFFYLRTPPRGAAEAFITYTLSPQGQQLVTQVGYFPVKGGAAAADAGTPSTDAGTAPADAGTPARR